MAKIIKTKSGMVFAGYFKGTPIFKSPKSNAYQSLVIKVYPNQEEAGKVVKNLEQCGHRDLVVEETTTL